MATIRNPTRWDLWCHPLRRELRAKERVTGLTDAVAEEISRTGVFTWEEREREADGAPTRRAAKRGADEAEVTAQPVREKRG